MSASLLGLKHILIGDHDAASRQALRGLCERAFGEFSGMEGRERYHVVEGENGHELIARAEDIARRGGRLDLAIIGVRFEGTRANEAPEALKAIDPKLSIMALTARPDRQHKLLNYAIDLYEKKPIDANGIIRKIELLLERADRRAMPLFLGDHRVIKVAETPSERDAWFRLRKEVYVDELGYVVDTQLCQKEVEDGVEFDEYDGQRSTDQIVCMDYSQTTGKCVAGLRGVYGRIPVEALCDLASWREANKETEPAEASRLILQPSARRDPKLLIELVRVAFDISTSYPVKFCTCQPDQAGLYKLMGFLPISKHVGDSGTYRLQGDWVPMMLDHRDIHHHLSTTSSPADGPYRDFSPELYTALTTRILHDRDTLKLGKKYRHWFLPPRRRRSHGR